MSLDRKVVAKHAVIEEAFQPEVFHEGVHDRERPDPAIFEWSRKISGKTVSRWLTGDQVERYEDLFSNAKQARELLTELEALSLRIAERTEVWDPQAAHGSPGPNSGQRQYLSTGETTSTGPSEPTDYHSAIREISVNRRAEREIVWTMMTIMGRRGTRHKGQRSPDRGLAQRSKAPR